MLKRTIVVVVAALAIACGPTNERSHAPDCTAVPMPDECDNSRRCYVEPSEHRCDYLTALPAVQAEPMYCNAPQAQPWAPYCEAFALDTGAEIGSRWCCWSDLQQR